MRSTTWSRLEFCALAFRAAKPSIITAHATFDTRIYAPSVSELKYDVRDGGKIHRVPLFERWFETNLLCCPQRGFVQSVSQSFYYANRFHLARGLKHHFNKYFAFDSQPACFLRVNRVGLG